MTQETPKVLIVDDEELLLRSLRRLMNKDAPDIRSFWTRNGEEALKVMEEENPQVAVVDLMLEGGLSGIKTIQEIQRRWPETIPMVFTGYIDWSELERIIGPIKCFKLFFKPCENYMFISIVREALAFQRKMKAREFDSDRRRAPRLAIAVPVRLFARSGKVSGTLCDISMTGARIETAVPLTLDETVGFDMTIDEYYIKGGGNVVRLITGGMQYSSGIRFTSFEGDSEKNLLYAIQRYLYFQWT